VACSPTQVLRHFSEENSAVMTLTLASMPPMPTPVSARSSASCVASCASADNSMPAAMSSRHSKMTLWRPMRSASGATNSEPAAMPNRPALNSVPSWAPLSFHSAATLEAVKAITSTSKPSSITSITQMATAIHWNRLMAPSSSALWMSNTNLLLTGGRLAQKRRAQDDRPPSPSRAGQLQSVHGMSFSVLIDNLFEKNQTPREFPIQVLDSGST